ncbi:carbonic anhydrase family protein [Massilibacteroides sp.]|uniref:carbonic anhydrase family protein n=1 Tax=Massilibacteroides sp. TaxID=2034766 RepID=UPI00262ACAEB|nr:carbonic anhydrase family protein [Massilibacteroides sp.]MDD4514983.1 carbonic anhydrase family protein [Massilibacteroides sp.]
MEHIPKKDILSGHVLTAEEQAKLTPHLVLDILKKGNQDFVRDHLTVRNNSGRIRNASLGQYPMAVVLSCLDSRVPVEDIFHCGIGDLFVARVAGNIVNDDILGSLEIACKVSGAKLILVLGHEYCSAIKSTIDNLEMGNITQLLNKIRPAVALAKQDFEGEQTSKNELFMDKVCLCNVQLSIREILDKSSILKEMKEKGDIDIIGGIYDMKKGAVKFTQTALENKD